MTTRSRQLIEDVAAAAAAYLWNILPEIIKLPCVDGFERLNDHFRTAFIAYFAELNDRFPEPSDN